MQWLIAQSFCAVICSHVNWMFCLFGTCMEYFIISPLSMSAFMLHALFVHCLPELFLSQVIYPPTSQHASGTGLLHCGWTYSPVYSSTAELKQNCSAKEQKVNEYLTDLKAAVFWFREIAFLASFLERSVLCNRWREILFVKWCRILSNVKAAPFQWCFAAAAVSVPVWLFLWPDEEQRCQHQPHRFFTDCGSYSQTHGCKRFVLISALGAVFTSQLFVIRYATMNIWLILKQQCDLEESMHKGVN